MKEGLKEKLHYAKLGVMASIPEAAVFCNAIVVQAKVATTEAAGDGNTVVSKVNTASINGYSVMKGIFVALLLLVIGGSGLMLAIGTKNMKEAVKENFYWIVLGCALLFLAQDVVGWIEEIFG